MSAQPPPVGVLGAGSWGTALAIRIALNGRRVRLWGRVEDGIDEMAASRCNAHYLPGIELPEGLSPTTDLEGVVADCRDLFIVIPSEGFAPTLRRLQPLLGPQTRIAWATKGLDAETGRLLHEVVEELLGGERPTAVVSGPSFATEVARELPTAVTVASRFAEFAAEVTGWLHSDTFRVYTSDDLVGVELGGAVKNVFAIAAGISDGLGFGANARAALVTRGLAEMMRLGEAAGARRETLMGLSGVGDLVLTCTDDQSRNRRLGLALGRGVPFDAAAAEIGQAVEGAKTARVVMRMAERLGVEMPIAQEVYRVLYDGHTPANAVTALLGRDLKPEFGD
jgi:glycerol-3-phosphate dehydrogenase (NAD(P)+)